MSALSGGALSAQVCPTPYDPLAVAHQAPLSMEFSRHEYWSGVPFPTPGDLPDLGITPSSPAYSALILSALSTSLL